MKFILPFITLAALFMLNNGADARLLFGNGNANENAQGPPDFLDDDHVPPGLVDNPSGAVGVDIKPGRKVFAQNQPDKAKPHKPIRGLDNKAIELDTETAERINVYNPDNFQLSEDGTFVTDVESGEAIPLSVFYFSDDANDADVTFVVDTDGGVRNVRVAPKTKANENANGNGNMPKIQNFQRLKDSEDVLVGYYDDDVDLSTAPAYGDIEEGDGDDDGTRLRFLTKAKKFSDPNDRETRRRLQYPMTLWGKECTEWDYLDVNIVTDVAFFSYYYYDHALQAQAIFAEAGEIYWKESCIRLWMWRYEKTAGNPDWYGFDQDLTNNPLSGCNNYGALDILSTYGRARPNEYRDVWHMFSRLHWQDPNEATGCAYINSCESIYRGYGVNSYWWTTNLRFQAVIFAHELGHNLGLEHLSTSNHFWVMEPAVNLAPYDFHYYYSAPKARDAVVGNPNCGWF